MSADMPAEQDKPESRPTNRPTGPWAGRVKFSAEGGGFAYRPGEVCTTGEDRAIAFARQFSEGVVVSEARVGPFLRLQRVPDPLLVARELRRQGFLAQPNHVYFSHGCGPGCGCPSPCPPHPAAPACPPCVCGATRSSQASPVYAGPVYASPVYASPVYASPVYASPVYASPVYASPVYASPVYASPVYASPSTAYRQTGVRRSSARPPTAEQANDADTHLGAGAGSVEHPPSVVVLDTGLAGLNCPSRIDAARIRAVAVPVDHDGPDEDHDLDLDPAAGHGTFIAGLVDQVAPGCNIDLRRVLSTFGDGDEWAISQAIGAARENASDPEHTLFNLSFGGYALEHPFLLASVVAQAQEAGIVVVASAGNDATCHPTYPAALPDVVSVGAIGPSGAAPFTNYGPWVRSCAPGVDVVSTFFEGFDGSAPNGPAGTDPDRFHGWAVWSGTSFSAPIVAGALARAMIAAGSTAREAVARVIDDPSLMRLDNLGTVVNVT
ncbi:MAG: S8 family peptidase [Acidimicrobiia bacterium]